MAVGEPKLKGNSEGNVGRKGREGERLKGLNCQSVRVTPTC